MEGFTQLSLYISGQKGIKFTTIREMAIVLVTAGLVGCGDMNEALTNSVMPDKKVVIAHRGASGYLPEHTLPAAAMAHGMGADFVEPDVVLTKDDVPIVLHDIHMESTTNIREKFPDRAREDGRWYAIDFTLKEIKSLSVSERVDPKTNEPVFPNRFPINQGTFVVPTLAEMIELVQGLNESTQRSVGIYPELKAPAFHTSEGYDIGETVLKVLDKYGYKGKDANVYVQCFDPEYLEHLREDYETDLPLIQLLAPNEWEEANADYHQLMQKPGLARISKYANGIGLWFRQIKDEPNQQPSYVVNPNIVKDAHSLGLKVHVYTFRKDALPSYVESFDELQELFLFDFDVDGIFTDFAGDTVSFLRDKS